MKKAQGSALTMTETNSDISTGFPERTDIAFLTIKPARTISEGIKIAHRNPMTVCL
jgi:hypothetical protein